VTKTDPIDWTESGPIYRYPINAAIGSPAANQKLARGTVEVTGYILPAGRADCRVKNVEVSADGRKTWAQAEMTGKDAAFCWQLWKAKVEVTEKTKRLVVRATDTQGHFMPGRVPWNAKGYLQNSWYRLPVQVGT